MVTGIEKDDQHPALADGLTQRVMTNTFWRNIQMRGSSLPAPAAQCILFTPGSQLFMSHFECIFGQPKAITGCSRRAGQHTAALHRLELGQTQATESFIT